MNKKYLIGAVIVVGFLLMILSRSAGRNDSSPNTLDSEVESAEETQDEYLENEGEEVKNAPSAANFPAPSDSGAYLIATMLAVQDMASVEGATVIPAGDKIQIIMSFNDTRGSRPAAIHSGRCPNYGEQKYPLKTLVEGVSNTEINVVYGDLKKLGPLAVVVQADTTGSNRPTSPYVYCGQLVR